MKTEHSWILSRFFNRKQTVTLTKTENLSRFVDYMQTVHLIRERIHEFCPDLLRAECRILRADARALHIITEIRGHKHYYNPWSMFRLSVAWQKVSDLSLMSGREYNKIETKYVETRRRDSTRSDPENNKHEKGQKTLKENYVSIRVQTILTWSDPDMARSWRGPIC